MYGEADRAQDHEQVAGGDREILLDAQQIGAGRRDHDADPDRQRDALFKQQAEQRHNHDIQRREEARLADRRELDADLLQTRRHAEREAAQHAADPKHFPAVSRRAARFSFPLPAPQERDDRQQADRRDEVAHAVEGKRAEIVHPEALRDKRRAPDQRGQRQKQRTPELFQIDHHSMLRRFSCRPGAPLPEGPPALRPKIRPPFRCCRASGSSSSCSG